MKPRSITIRVTTEMGAAMDALQERYGTPLSEQVRRALQVWLENQGLFKPERKGKRKGAAS